MLTIDVQKKMDIAATGFAAAYQRACQIDGTAPPVLHRVHDHLRARVLAAAEGADRIDAARRGEQAMLAFAGLAAHHRVNLGESDRLRAKVHIGAAEIDRQTAAGEAAAWASHPLLASVHAEMQAAAEGRRQATEAATEAATLAAQAAYPSALVARLRAAGVHLALGADGDGLTVHEGDRLSDHDLAELRHHRAGVIEALQAETEAAKARPIELRSI